jgi:hypothetical protein
MGDCPVKSVDWRSSQSTANPDFSLEWLREVGLCFLFSVVQVYTGRKRTRDQSHGQKTGDIAGQKTGDIARLHVVLTRSSRGTQARFQSQPDRRLPSPGVLAIRSATRHRVTQPLEVARRQRLVDALQPLLIADRLFALPQQRIAAPPNPVGSTTSSPRLATHRARHSAAPKGDGRHPEPERP